MNHNRRPLESKIRKKMQKEVKAAQATYSIKEQPLNSDQVTALDLVKKYPKKVAKKDQSLLRTTLKEMKIKEKKLHETNQSKRTTPGEILGQPGAPTHTKRESNRWEKTLVKQDVLKGKLTQRKFAKKHLPKK